MTTHYTTSSSPATAGLHQRQHYGSSSPSIDSIGNTMTAHPVTLDIGGRRFKVAVSTLTSNSSYFAAMFSNEWQQQQLLLNMAAGGVGHCQTPFFIDQDPGPFETLLSFMRVGCIDCAELTIPVLLQAEFFGIERLLDAVKVAAYENRHPSPSRRQQATVTTTTTDEEETIIANFNQQYASVSNAIRIGVLPFYLTHQNEGTKQYAQLNIHEPTYMRYRRQLTATGELPSAWYEDLAVSVVIDRNVVETSSHLEQQLIRAQPLVGMDNDERDNAMMIMNCHVFLDALNWLSAHGFNTIDTENLFQTRDEEGNIHRFVFSRTQRLSQFSIGLDRLSDLIVGRNMVKYKSNHNTRNLQPRQFAAVVQPASKDDAAGDDDREIYIEADSGRAMTHELDVLGEVPAAENYTSRIGRLESWGKFAYEGLDWLESHRYTRREREIECLYQQYKELCVKQRNGGVTSPTTTDENGNTNTDASAVGRVRVYSRPLD